MTILFVYCGQLLTTGEQPTGNISTMLRRICEVCSTLAVHCSIRAMYASAQRNLQHREHFCTMNRTLRRGLHPSPPTWSSSRPQDARGCRVSCSTPWHRWWASHWSENRPPCGCARTCASPWPTRDPSVEHRWTRRWCESCYRYRTTYLHTRWRARVHHGVSRRAKLPHGCTTSDSPATRPPKADTPPRERYRVRCRLGAPSSPVWNRISTRPRGAPPGSNRCSADVHWICLALSETWSIAGYSCCAERPRLSCGTRRWTAPLGWCRRTPRRSCRPQHGPWHTATGTPAAAWAWCHSSNTCPLSHRSLPARINRILSSQSLPHTAAIRRVAPCVSPVLGHELFARPYFAAEVLFAGFSTIRTVLKVLHVAHAKHVSDDAHQSMSLGSLILFVLWVDPWSYCWTCNWLRTLRTDICSIVVLRKNYSLGRVSQTCN